MQSPKYRWLWVVLLFLPLLFISNRSSHDWGDDFAQYIHQAKNIVQGMPQSETGYIFNPENRDIGPKAYPVGFPLLLTPVYAVFGLNMKAYTVFISLIYFVLGLLLVKFFQRYFSFVAAVALTAIFLYNPQMLIFKQEVMSDLPFAMLLVTALLLYKPEKEFTWLRVILVALVIGFMISIRPIGFVFIIAMAIDTARNFIGKKSPGDQIKNTRQITRQISAILSPVIIYVGLNMLMFKIPSGGSLANYFAFFSVNSFARTALFNLDHYLEVFRFIYTPGVGVFSGFALMCGYFVTTMVIIGFIRKVTARFDMVDIFFILYVLVLLVYPNNASAFRFMVPVGFILLMYAAYGIKAIMVVPRVNARVKALVLSGFMLVLFLPGIINIIKSRNTTLPGPQEKPAIEAFTYIRENLPDNAVIMFVKPRALSLYAERTAFADPVVKDMTKFHEQAMAAGVNYFLISNSISSEEPKRYMRVMNGRTEKVWSNDVFELYRLKSFNP